MFDPTIPGGDPTIPEGYPYDPVTLGSFSAPPIAYGVGVQTAQQDMVHGKTNGYLPGWHWVPPPGVGDAPQMVYDTFALFPLSVDGPGDRPATYFKSLQAPIIQNFAMRWQGMAVDGGNILMTGLYTPDQMASPSNDVFSG
jgi:hypothetical protein